MPKHVDPKGSGVVPSGLSATDAEDREHGEWFRPSERLLSYIAALPDQVAGQRSERKLEAA